ncbi:MAG: PDZ domain-containing protein [Planctomycetaceae bacterium]
MTEFEPNEPQQPRHTRFFWLLLATIALLASAGALTLWLPYHQRQAAIAEIESRGGSVSTRPGGPPWLQPYFDPGQLAVFDEVMGIDLMNADFTDEDMDLLVELPEAQGLAIFAPSLTDAGFMKLTEMEGLRSLLMVNCPRVSSEALKELAALRPQLQIMRRGEAFLGIAGITTPQGCQVAQVVPGSGADRAGIRPGDFIVAFDETPVSTYESLTDLLIPKQSGQTVTLKLLRAGLSAPFDVEATLGGWQATKH